MASVTTGAPDAPVPTGARAAPLNPATDLDPFTDEQWRDVNVGSEILVVSPRPVIELHSGLVIEMWTTDNWRRVNWTSSIDGKHELTWFERNNMFPRTERNLAQLPASRAEAIPDAVLPPPLTRLTMAEDRTNLPHTGTPAQRLDALESFWLVATVPLRSPAARLAAIEEAIRDTDLANIV